MNPVCVCVCCIKNARSIKGVHWTCVRVAPGCSTFLTISTVHNVRNRRWYNMYVRGCIYSTRLRYQSRADQRGVNIVYKHTTSYRVFLRLKNRRETPFAIFPFFVCVCHHTHVRALIIKCGSIFMVKEKIIQTHTQHVSLCFCLFVISKEIENHERASLTHSKIIYALFCRHEWMQE